jgi:hypothetical protein
MFLETIISTSNRRFWMVGPFTHDKSSRSKCRQPVSSSLLVVYRLTSLEAVLTNAPPALITGGILRSTLIKSPLGLQRTWSLLDYSIPSVSLQLIAGQASSQSQPMRVSTMVLARPNFPDEILSLIVRQLDKRSLRQSALVSKRWHKLAQPELFYEIDLARRNAAEVEHLYNDLFAPKGDNEHGSLKGQHVHTITYSFHEEFRDETEMNDKLAATHDLFQALSGVSILELELVLSEEASPAFENIMLPAIRAFFDSTRDKVHALSLSIDIGQSMAFMEDEEEVSPECVTQKLSDIFALVPPGIISSLQLVNVAVTSLPSALTAALVSPAFKFLSLQDCGAQAFNLLPTVPNLEKLTVGWGAQSENQSALEAAYNIVKNSATTARSITLHNNCSWNMPLQQGWTSALALPQLTRLHLSDCHLGPNSLFDRIFSHTSVPLLRTLVLEMDDILESAQILWERLENLHHIRNLKLVQRGDKHDWVTTPIEPGYFKMLETRCSERHVVLESTIWVRCVTPDELAQEYKRLAIFGNSVTDVSINCRSGSLAQVSQLSPLLFPQVLQMSVVLSDISVLGFSDPAASQPAKADNLKALFDKVACPNLKTLRITLFVNNASAAGSYADIQQILHEGIYPSLEILEGGLIASPIEQQLQVACQVAGVDCSRLAFVSHEELNDGDDGLADDEESIMSDEGADMLEDDSQSDASMRDDVQSSGCAKSDSGDSGYAVELGSPGPLREARWSPCLPFGQLLDR